ncbi:CC-NBS-LRR resistance protein [Tanacetum coccineum]
MVEALVTASQELEMIRAMLQDAERRNGTEAAVKVWMKQLRDVVSEADDLLDEVQYQVLRKEVKNEITTTSKILCFPELKKFHFEEK